MVKINMSMGMGLFLGFLVLISSVLISIGVIEYAKESLTPMMMILYGLGIGVIVFIIRRLTRRKK